MKKTRKNYEEPQFVLIEVDLKCNILAESLEGGEGQAGEGTED